MASLHETAYPRLKADLGPPELAAIFTPTMDELAFAAEHTQASSIARLGLLLLLKLFQWLGYCWPRGSSPITMHWCRPSRVL